MGLVVTPRAIVLCLALLAGCPPNRPQNPDVRPLPTPDEARRQVDEGARSRKTLRAQGRVTYFGDEGRVRLGLVEVVERPARFRLETLSPLEQPIDVMVSDGERLSLLRNGQLHEGPATPENVARLLPLPLRPHEIVDVLLGGVPLSDTFKPLGIDWAESPADHWKLTLAGPGGEVAELTIDPVRRVVIRAIIKRADQKVRMEVQFDDFLGDRAPFPRTVEIKMPDRNLEVSLKLKEVEVDVAIDPSLFVLKAPPGVAVIPLPTPPVVLPPPETGRP